MELIWTSGHKKVVTTHCKRVFVCVCVWVWLLFMGHTYIYICICMCLCIPIASLPFCTWQRTVGNFSITFAIAGRAHVIRPIANLLIKLLAPKSLTPIRLLNIDRGGSLWVLLLWLLLLFLFYFTIVLNLRQRTERSLSLSAINGQQLSLDWPIFSSVHVSSRCQLIFQCRFITIANCHLLVLYASVSLFLRCVLILSVFYVSQFHIFFHFWLELHTSNQELMLKHYNRPSSVGILFACGCSLMSC